MSDDFVIDVSPLSKPAYFVTGTDTAVGKTHVVTALIRALVRSGRRTAAMKPVAAGAHVAPGGQGQPAALRNDDALALASASNVSVPYSTTNPYCFAEAVSPHIAAKTAGIVIDPEVICREFAKLAADSECVIVEGAGGWLAPIGGDRTMADIATALGLPVILVIGLRLGCLNHALLTAQAIRASGLDLVHWVGNAIDPSFERVGENVATLAAALGEPLALVPHRVTIGS